MMSLTEMLPLLPSILLPAPVLVPLPTAPLSVPGAEAGAVADEAIEVIRLVDGLDDGGCFSTVAAIKCWRKVLDTMVMAVVAVKLITRVCRPSSSASACEGPLDSDRQL